MSTCPKCQQSPCYTISQKEDIIAIFLETSRKGLDFQGKRQFCVMCFEVYCDVAPPLPHCLMDLIEDTFPNSDDDDDEFSF